ncbi:MAG TPA: hypothetical protein VNT42_07440 [Sphingomonas sp.]|nr:hypothetical protein [Sphingomonas sp.]
MKALAERRARITRVREVQHLHAVGEAATAEGKVAQLENNAARLIALRMSLSMAPGITSGAALGNAGEMGLRLDTVRHGLADAIGAAKAVALARVHDRQDADIRRESAARLETRAVAELQQMIEARMAASFRHRPRKEPSDG